MEMDNMDTLPITLIVKAPNQLIEDQTIKCESTWSIKRLKEHLSQVYPSNPPQNEQKLIYSGQLLNENVVLKDVLREYGEPKRIHTIHLVCTPKYSKKSMKPQPNPNTRENNAMENIVETPPPIAENNSTVTTAVNDRVPNLEWYNNYNNMHQFMMMQHTYVQYMQHYMNIAHLQQYGAPMPGLSGPYNLNEYDNNRLTQEQGTLVYRNNAAGAAPGVGDVAAVGLVPPPPFNNGGNDVVAEQDAPIADLPAPPAQPQQLRGIGLNDDRDHRDWLDHFYMVCRIMIFVSIVYFYSSAVRFIVVFFTAICLYLYQIGFFRNVNINNNDINANERRPGEGAIGVARVPGAALAAEPDNNDDQLIRQQERDPSRLMVVWTFVTTFLASLLPEIPNVV